MLTLPSDHSFFGLTFEYNQRVFDQIFDICFYSEGAFHFRDVYEMPVNLRSYYYVKLADVQKKREQARATELNALTGRKRG